MEELWTNVKHFYECVQFLPDMSAVKLQSKSNVQLHSFIFSSIFHRRLLIFILTLESSGSATDERTPRSAPGHSPKVEVVEMSPERRRINASR